MADPWNSIGDFLGRVLGGLGQGAENVGIWSAQHGGLLGIPFEGAMRQRQFDVLKAVDPSIGKYAPMIPAGFDINDIIGLAKLRSQPQGTWAQIQTKDPQGNLVYGHENLATGQERWDPLGVGPVQKQTEKDDPFTLWHQQNPQGTYPQWLAAQAQKPTPERPHFTTEYEGTRAFTVARDPIDGHELWRKPAGATKPTAEQIAALGEFNTATANINDLLTTGQKVLPTTGGWGATITPEKLAVKARMGDPDVTRFNAAKISLIPALRAVAGAARINPAEIQTVTGAISGATSYPALKAAVDQANRILQSSKQILENSMGMTGPTGADGGAPGLPDMSSVGTPVYSKDGRVIGFTK